MVYENNKKSHKITKFQVKSSLLQKKSDFRVLEILVEWDPGNNVKEGTRESISNVETQRS